MVTALITNPAGRKTISAPLMIHTEFPAVTPSLDKAANLLRNTWMSAIGYTYRTETSSDLMTWNNANEKVFDGEGIELFDEVSFNGSPALWSRLKVSQKVIP